MFQVIGPQGTSNRLLVPVAFNFLRFALGYDQEMSRGDQGSVMPVIRLFNMSALIIIQPNT
jgi:hypothetical protein